MLKFLRGRWCVAACNRARSSIPIRFTRPPLAPLQHSVRGSDERKRRNDKKQFGFNGKLSETIAVICKVVHELKKNEIE
ncbi:hypothetical protein RR46_10803 [Papilio xuthus]|uniref:Uncharacterized protein n=1 Tax=Papilio xuthus TaxID=66420 RepID=A0A194PKL1_PAPXU|nr:hypothetical protein RR46_10803 [Papilio xuthus]